jgi:tricorn protease
MNLYSPISARRRRSSSPTFKDWDIKFPSIGKDAIVFEQAGQIWRYDLASGQAAAFRSLSRKTSLPAAPASLTPASTSAPSPPGLTQTRHRRRAWRALLRPGKRGHSTQPTRTSNAHERECCLVAGRQVDRLQLRRHRRERALHPFAGRQGRAATDHERRGHLITTARSWSPDSTKLLWSDRLLRLRYVDVASKASRWWIRISGERSAATAGRQTAMDRVGAAGGEGNCRAFSCSRRAIRSRRR